MKSAPHSPMYTMHKYWARKPHNVVSEYIQKYTQKGDIILDPFCGSGPTVVEGLKLHRRVVGMDLNPLAIFITRMTATPYDIQKIEQVFKLIEKNCRNDIETLYNTECSQCHQSAQIICTHWHGQKPVQIYYNCSQCQKELHKIPADQDINLISNIAHKNIPYWYPQIPLAYEDGTEFQENSHNPNIKTINQLFTTRNLHALTILNHQIEAILDFQTRDFFQYAFTSFLHLASSMALIRPSRPKSGCWTVHRYYIPQSFMESNVWNLFDRAIHGRQGLCNALRDTNNTIKHNILAKQFTEFNLDQGVNALIQTQNAMQLTQKIPLNSIDFVFTDPPYGKDIQYAELSTLWASWLRVPLNYIDEIVINYHQKKDITEYETMLATAFREIFLVLKPRHYMVVTFNSMNIHVWIAIFNSIMSAGFTLDSMQYHSPAKISAKALLAKEGSAIGDFYFIFQKPESKGPTWKKITLDKGVDKAVLKSMKQLLYTKPTSERLLQEFKRLGIAH